MSELIDPAFSEISVLIQSVRQQTFRAVNTAMIDLYWRIGETISHRAEAAGWGKDVVQQFAFYFEALDRDVKKPRGQQSIGVLLCAGKDTEVVEYSLSRTLSPAMVADYQNKLPDKSLLQRKLAEFYELEVARAQR